MAEVYVGGVATFTLGAAPGELLQAYALVTALTLRY